MGVVIKATKLVPILARLGFKAVKQSGSHLHLENFFDKTKKVTIPIHNKDLPIKTLKSILKQAGISMKDFLKIIGR